MSTATVEAAPAVEAQPAPAAPAPDFDPSRGLIKIEGKGRQANEYLPVNWRVLWLRTDHPLATILTEQVQLTADWAVFKATITLENGAIGTGFGSQSSKQFTGGFLEKAETKAIGRACAALGYGTLAAFEEGDSIADAPASRPQASGQNGHAPPAAEEWDWPKLWAWLKPRGVADRAGLEHAARRSTEGMAPGEIKRVIDAIDKLVSMADDKLLGLVGNAERPEGLRLSAAHEYCRRADDQVTLAVRFGQVAAHLPKEKAARLYGEHAARLGIGQAPKPTAQADEDPPWDDVVGPPANPPGELSTAEKGKQPATDAQLLAIQSLAKQRGLSQETVLEGMKTLFPDVPTLKRLTRIQAGQLIDDIRRSNPVEEATS